jgi:hypothetical protein
MFADIGDEMWLGLNRPQNLYAVLNRLPQLASYNAEAIQRIVLASQPVGEPALDNFRSERLPIPQPGPGEMLLRTLWLSLVTCAAA